MGLSCFNTLYSQQNNSTQLLNQTTTTTNNSNATTTAKLPASPTSMTFANSSNNQQTNFRGSPSSAVSARSPLSGLDTNRSTAAAATASGSHQSNRTSVISASGVNAITGRVNGNTGLPPPSSSSSTASLSSTTATTATSGTITEDQVIRALQERPAQDAVLQLYLAQKGDPNIVDSNGNSLLHLAIIAHSQASVVFLLNSPDIRLEHGSPISPLYTAVRFRSWKAAQQLLIQGANPNVHDERGLSVLHIVLLFMNKGDTLAEEVVHLLCESKADVNCTANDKKIIPLLVAVERELWAEVEILMAYGANPYLIWGRDRRLSSGISQQSQSQSQSQQPLPPLPPLPSDGSSTPTGYFNDPLWEAVNEDKVHLVRLLLKFYYAPSSFSATGSSPSPSPSSTQSSQSFFGPQHPALQQQQQLGSVSSFSTFANGSSSNVNIPINNSNSGQSPDHPK
ncbi:hypothetical protein BG004_000238 [Podila humilis]|nr:hypothetical protein BG004_000238 [Podila humilis]